MGEGCQTCVLVRRAFCHGGTDLYYLTYFSHQLLGNSRSKKCEITPEGTSKRQRWDSGLFQMIQPPLQHGANSPAWNRDEMCVLFPRMRRRVGRTIHATHSSERVVQFSWLCGANIFIPSFHTRRLKLDTSFRLAFLNPLEQKWEGEMGGVSYEDGHPAHSLPGQKSGFGSQTGQGSSFPRPYFGCFTFSGLEECHSWRLRLSVILTSPICNWGPKRCLSPLGLALPGSCWNIQSKYNIFPSFCNVKCYSKSVGEMQFKGDSKLFKTRIEHSHRNIIHKTPWWFSACDIWKHGQIVYFPLLSKRLHTLGQWYYANTLARFFSKNELRA